MILQELKKVLFRQYGLVLFILLGLGGIWNFHHMNDVRIRYQREGWESLYEKFEGSLTKEKYNLFMSTTGDLKKLIDADTSAEQLASGKITYTEYIASCKLLDKATDQLDSYNKLGKVIQYVHASDRNLKVVFDYGWQNVLMADRSVVFFLILLYCYVVLYATDSGCQVGPSLLVTKNGRASLVFARGVAGVILTFMFSVSDTLVSVVMSLCYYTLHYPLAPIQSLMEYAEYNGSITILGAILLKILLSVVGGLVVGFVMYAIDHILKNRFITMFTGIFLLLSQYVLPGAMHNSAADYFNVDSAFLNNRIFVLLWAGVLVILVCVVVTSRNFLKLPKREKRYVNEEKA